MENNGDVWHRATAERIGRAVAERRKLLGLTAQQLAQRCGELGVPIHRTTITKIENGRPRFDLGELIVLAAALDTSPAVLVYPGPYSGQVELLPSRKVSEFEAAQWFSGLGYWWIVDDLDVYDNAVWQATGRAWISSLRQLRAYRMFQETETMRAQVVERGDFDRDHEQIAYYDRLIEHLRQEALPDMHGDA